MTIKITTPNGGSDSLDFGCAQTAIVATVTGTEVSSGEGKLELKTTTGGTSATKATILANGRVGIGTATADEALQVNGAIKVTAGMATDTASTGAMGYQNSKYRFISWGADTSTKGAFGFEGYSSNGSVNATHLAIDATGKVGIGMTPVAYYGLLQVGSAVTSALGVTGLQAYVSGTNSAVGQNGNVSIVTTDGQAANIGGSIGFGGKYVAAGNSGVFASISGRKENGTDNNGAGYLQFATEPNGGIPTERMRITSDGYVLVGTTISNPGAGNTTAGFTMLPDGRFFSSTGGTYSQMNRSSDGTILSFSRSGNGVGSIGINSSSTAYNTSSDYRLKENVEYDWDATTRLKQLKPARFNFKINPDDTVDGFIAHEAQAVVPEAVTGVKDEVDDDDKPVMQGIDQAKLVPLLVKTIQELEARIAKLEEDK